MKDETGVFIAGMATMFLLGLMVIYIYIVLGVSAVRKPKKRSWATGGLPLYRELRAAKIAVEADLNNGRISIEDANDKLDSLENEMQQIYGTLSDWEKNQADDTEDEDWKRV